MTLAEHLRTGTMHEDLEDVSGTCANKEKNERKSEKSNSNESTS